MEIFIKKFKNWNNALIENLIPENDQFILFVNDDIINDIGTENNLGDADNFIGIINQLNNTEFRDKVFNVLHRWEYASPLRNIPKTKSLLDFAVCVGNNFTAKYYVSFIVYTLLIASRSQDNIGEVLNNTLGTYTSITHLFEKLKQDYPKFNNGRSTNYRHVGLIRFQLILAPWQEKSIQRALNKVGYSPLLDWDYYKICCQICDHVDDRINKIIELSLKNCNEAIIVAERLQNIFENFDPDEFNSDVDENNAQKTDKKIAKLLSFAICIPNNGERIAKLNLYTNISNCISNNDLFLEEGPLNCNGNNGNPVELNDSITLKKYSFDSDNYTLNTFETDEVVIFYRVHNYLYMQHPEFKQTSALVFVRNNNKIINKFSEWTKNNNQNFDGPLDFNIEGVNSNDWIVYHTDILTKPYYKPRNYNTQKNVNRGPQGFIVWHNKKDRYPINHLPYFTLPNNASSENTTLSINIDGVEASERISYIINDNKLFLLSTDFDTDYTDSHHSIDFMIEIKDEQKVNLHGSFKVYEPLIRHIETPFKYDKFGKIVTEDQENVIRGIYVEGDNTINEIGTLNQNCQEYDRDEFFRRSIFVNLIASKCYEQENGDISTNTFDRTLDYFLSCYPEVSINNKKIIKHKLINTGVVCNDPQKGRIQAIPPRLLRIPQAFNFFNREIGEYGKYTCPEGLYCYILVGCYTRQFLIDLEQLVDEHNGRLYIKDNSFNDDICPPTLIIRVSPTVTHEAMCNEDILLNTFKLALNSNTEFSNSLEFRENTQQDFLDHLSKKDVFDKEKDISESFPRIRKDKNPTYNQHYYIEQDSKRFCEIQRHQLPWASMYCQDKKNQPILIYNKDSKVIYIPCQNVKLPFFIQRALYIMNGGYPEFKDCFVCDYNSREEIYYTKMKKYNAWNNDNIDAIVAMLSNGTNTTIIRETKNQNNHTIEYWKKRTKFNTDSYCVLRENVSNEIIAYEHKGKVYYKDNNEYRILLGNFKEIFTFLLFNAVQKNGESLGVSKHYTFESKYEFGEETLIIPSPNDYTKSILEII